MNNPISTFLESKKELKLGEGYISGYLSIFFGFIGLGAVLCLKYPTLFANPELIEVYKNSIGFIKGLVTFFFYSSVIFGLLSMYLSRNIFFGLIGILFTGISLFLGGVHVDAVKGVGQGLYVGLDWFLIDLFVSVSIFILLEKLFGYLKNQEIFREGWFLDLKYFFINHILLGMILVTVNFVVNNVYSYLIFDSIQQYIQTIPIVLQVVFIFLVADFAFYWAHRAYHENAFLWKVHSIHHSAEKMDWLAGSRLHLIELFLTRILLIFPIIILGFSETAVNAYIVIVSIHSVFIHSNIYIKSSFLDKIIVLPKFHHWHHSDESHAINKNYAGQIVLYDRLFKTAILDDEYPKTYGITDKGDYPEGILKQTIYPFCK